jgi:hypothetical protein
MSARTVPGSSGGDYDLSDPINSFLGVVRRVVARPGEFFAGIPRRGNFLAPLVFALVCALVSAILRSTFLAAGQAMLAGYIEQGTAFNVGYVLSSVAGVMIAVAMLRSGVFGKATAHVGIAGNVLGMSLYVPTIGVFLAVLSVVALWGWYILIARRVFQLGRHVREEEVTTHRS